MCSVVVDASPRLSLEILEHEICELGAHIAAATCRWLLLIAEFDRREGWAKPGLLSCAHWLSWQCGIGLRTAQEHLRVAHALGALPSIRTAFGAGQLTYSKVRALTRVATPETEEDLLMIALHATGAQLDRLAQRYGRAIRAETGGSEEPDDRLQLHADWLEDGSLSLHGRLSAEDGALLLAALQAVELPREADGLRLAQRRAAALAELARGAARPCEVVVHVDADSLAGERIHERCEVADGPALAPETARRLACDGSLVRIVERDGTPLSVGRKRRVVSPALRRALRSRDGGGCAFPGCTNEQWLHAHHITHWAHGGATELSNLVGLCSRHHRLVHEGGYRIRRSPAGAISVEQPDGSVIPAAPPAPAIRGPGLPARQRGLRIDRDACAPRSAGGRLDYDHAVFALMQQRFGHSPPGG
jgi:hypothetical protein